MVNASMPMTGYPGAGSFSSIAPNISGTTPQALQTNVPTQGITPPATPKPGGGYLPSSLGALSNLPAPGALPFSLGPLAAANLNYSLGLHPNHPAGTILPALSSFLGGGR